MESEKHINPKFSKFLKENRCYVKYCYYLRKFGQIPHIPFFTMASIPWNKTDEGIKYWSEMNKKWIREILVEFIETCQ